MRSHRWSSLSIQTLIATAFSILIVLLISIVGLLSFMITTRTVDENTNQYVYQLVTQINYDIEYYLKNVESTVKTLEGNSEIINYFELTSDEAIKNKSLEDDLRSYMVSREDIINIFLVREDGNTIINQGNYQLKPQLEITQEDWYTKALNADKMMISNAHIQNLIVNRYKWVVSWSASIRDAFTDEPLGVILVDLNFNLIQDMLNNLSLGEKGYMFILDSNGNIIYHPKHELIYSGIRNEAIDLIMGSEDGYVSTIEDNRMKNYIVSTSDYSGWKVVGAVYEDELNPYDVITKQIYTLMIGLALTIAIFISIIISRNFLHPIKDLTEGMYRFKRGDLNTNVEVKSENEFGQLALAFNDMTVEIKNLINENKEKEKAKRKYELKSLQAQINPHFLYNTLDSIVWMAEAGMNKEVVDMTFSLSKLFRISINRGSEFVTVEEELEHIESYLKIQKLRYGDKLNYEINSDPLLLNYRIIKIIIQPIVENAIYHGIKKLHGPGFIHIDVKEIDNCIYFIIQDNGVGMEEETVKKLLDENGHQSTSKGGIGVKNVDQRIKLYYGEDYGVEIESAVFEGTKVKLIIPKEYNSEGRFKEKTTEGDYYEET